MTLLGPGWPESHTVQSSTPSTPDHRFLLLETLWYEAYWLMYGPGATQYSPVPLKVQFFDPVVVRYFPGCSKQSLVIFIINQIRIINPPVVSILVAVVVLDPRASPPGVVFYLTLYSLPGQLYLLSSLLVSLLCGCYWSLRFPISVEILSDYQSQFCH